MDSNTEQAHYYVITPSCITPVQVFFCIRNFKLEILYCKYNVLHCILTLLVKKEPWIGLASLDNNILHMIRRSDSLKMHKNVQNFFAVLKLFSYFLKNFSLYACAKNCDHRNWFYLLATFFGSILITFEVSNICWGGWGIRENCLLSKMNST